MPSSNIQLEILYSKYHGTIYINSEYSASNPSNVCARPKYIANLQLFLNDVPFVAPSDLYPDILFNNDPLNICRNTTKYTSSNSPVSLYKNVWTAPLPGGVNCFWYVDATLNDPTTNLFSKAIPWNLDPNLGYNPTLQVSPIVSNTISPFDMNNPWIFDGDAGYITFLGSNQYSINPTFTFWRYEGSLGLSGYSGATGSANVGSQGVQGSHGAQGSQGQNGFPGEVGTQGSQGYSGESGTTGSQGETSASITGLYGNQGVRGEIGATGNQGTQGFLSAQLTGPQGTMGYSGITGAQGVQGNTGAQGVIGFAGFSGIVGSTGVQGQTVYGNTGAQGLQGSRYNGIAGSQGNPGNSGSVISGYSGPSGYFGNAGELGYIVKSGWFIVNSLNNPVTTTPNIQSLTDVGAWGAYQPVNKIAVFHFNTTMFPQTKMPRYNGSINAYFGPENTYRSVSIPRLGPDGSGNMRDRLFNTGTGWYLELYFGSLTSIVDNNAFLGVSGAYFIYLNVFV